MEVVKKISLLVAAVLTITACERTLKPVTNPDEDVRKANPDAVNPDEFEYTESGDYLISDPFDVNVTANTPNGKFILDGKVTVGKFGGSQKFTTVWSSSFSMMQEGCDTPWLEDNIESLSQSDVFLGNGCSEVQDGFTDGGMWAIGTHQIPDGRLACFFHAESHFPDVLLTAYKSIGIAYSSDGGKTWDKGTKILSGPSPKPVSAEAGGRSYGLGDGCVVWNEKYGKWICYYCGAQDGNTDYLLCMAASEDPSAAPGTWKKWNGKDFTLEGCDSSTGLGGRDVAVAGLSRIKGGNPSVSWNTYLNKWIMVYHSWAREVVLSTSEDGLVWTTPRVIVSKEMEPKLCIMPNLIGEEGDLRSGREFRVYYSTDLKNDGSRKIRGRIIRCK